MNTYKLISKSVNFVGSYLPEMELLRRIISSNSLLWQQVFWWLKEVSDLIGNNFTATECDLSKKQMLACFLKSQASFLHSEGVAGLRCLKADSPKKSVILDLYKDE